MIMKIALLPTLSIIDSDPNCQVLSVWTYNLSKPLGQEIDISWIIQQASWKVSQIQHICNIRWNPTPIRYATFPDLGLKFPIY